jgi:hypothetical protein
MSSNINPNNIDGTYPVAGQDNNSQGFRDNFTNTKTNLQYAAEEITDLQAKGIFKSALTGTTLDNEMLGSGLSNAVIRDFAAARVALGTLTGSVPIDYSLGHYQTVTTGGSISLAFTNFPPAGAAGWLTVRISVSSIAHTLTLPAAVGASSSSTSTTGIQGFASNIITFAEIGTYELQFRTDDNGSSIYLSELTRPRAKFTAPLIVSSSEDLLPSTSASLTKATSYFTTAGAEVATLLAGQDGQIKTFAMVATAGNMVITVANAGWKASGTGTITFNAIGDACTLQYIADKWFCTGNNSVTFA